MTPPYRDFPTDELVTARKSLTALVERPDVTETQRRVFDELLCWTAIELADRVQTLVELNDPPCFGAALESLAFDVGFQPQPQYHHRRGSHRLSRLAETAPPPVVDQGRSPVPVRRGGRRRG